MTQDHFDPPGVVRVDRARVGKNGAGAVPEGANAIRVHFEEDEPAALVFHDMACSAALVSWAWCQLKMLDALLVAASSGGGPAAGEPDVAGAVRTVIGPVINALALSEQRAEQIRRCDAS